MVFVLVLVPVAAGWQFLVSEAGREVKGVKGREEKGREGERREGREG